MRYKLQKIDRAAAMSISQLIEIAYRVYTKILREYLLVERCVLGLLILISHSEFRNSVRMWEACKVYKALARARCHHQPYLHWASWFKPHRQLTAFHFSTLPSNNINKAIGFLLLNYSKGQAETSILFLIYCHISMLTPLTGLPFSSSVPYQLFPPPFLGQDTFNLLIIRLPFPCLLCFVNDKNSISCLL
ncbi:hypothetical protein JD844_005597 [Phrynosoma platyrhinos]|uniref:Uncharacterized protein n=1 Tax=Phrynosoma platyrhinos TaxID=52577 RepID=A0ABQ7TPK9_PHRPL|nr:hypothetical protein JD844_005597 [Phrynosoma platyrhinos]